MLHTKRILINGRSGGLDRLAESATDLIPVRIEEMHTGKWNADISAGITINSVQSR